MKNNIFWFRRDLRLDDNTALANALLSKNPIIPIFIFDSNIIESLAEDDARISFIYAQLEKINNALKFHKSSLLIKKGDPKSVFKSLINEFDIEEVYSNFDYEPYAVKRDAEITDLLNQNKIKHLQHKDQVIFEPYEILKDNGDPYTVYTPYKNKWLTKFKETTIQIFDSVNFEKFVKKLFEFPQLSRLGFSKSQIKVKDYSLEILEGYKENRDIPSLDKTSYLSVHLRFGTVSVRKIVNSLGSNDTAFLSELIWREFFMQILNNFPHVQKGSFKKKYDKIVWRNNKEEFKMWCEGKTGYPIVDAGMRQLNKTGYMHNRVRMITAGFLCKHLLIDWRWGEKYFAQKLLDYEMSSNNGNWQWAAGTGCDAAPYFRIFNPFTQQTKFDKSYKYVKKWIPEFAEDEYLDYMVDHKFARERALECYKSALS